MGGARWRRWARLAVVFTVVAGLAGTPLAAAAPIGDPPNGHPPLAPGQLPHQCGDADVALGFTGYAPLNGHYWSEATQRWAPAPRCYPRWGFIAMSPPQLAEAGDTVTMTILPDDPRLAGYVEAGFGGFSWTYPGVPVEDSCGLHDLSCTVVVGDPDTPAAEWGWGMFHASGPGRVFILPPSYAPRCQPDNPCIDTVTNAWSFVGVAPHGTPPVADFDFRVDGGEVSFNATSTDPGGSVLFHEWDFGDDETARGDNPAHTYLRSGTYPVTLTAENEDHLRDSITKNVTVVGQPLEVVDLTTDPPHPTIDDEVVLVTGRVLNHDDENAITDVSVTVSATPSDVLSGGGTSDPFDLPPGADGSFQVEVYPEQAGEAFLGVTAAGVGPDGPTTARAARLAVEIEGGDLIVTDIELDNLVREEEGGSATVRATVVNHVGADLDAVTADLVSTPPDDVSILPLTEPTPLADGEGATFEFDVQLTTTDLRSLRLSVEGTRVTDGLVVEADPVDIAFSLSHPLIRTATAERSGGPSASAGGGELVVVDGLNLDDVIRVELEIDGARYEATDLELVNDEEIRFRTPNLSAELRQQPEGHLAVDADLILVGLDGFEPPSELESNPVAFELRGPEIESIDLTSPDEAQAVATANALGGQHVVLTGRNLTDVTSAVFTDDDGNELPVDINILSDTEAELETPDATAFLEAYDDGIMYWLARLEVFWEEPLAPPYDRIRSNPFDFAFEGPVIETVVNRASEGASAHVAGGDVLVITGRNLRGVTGASFAIDGHPAQPGEVEVNDDEILVDAPRLTQFIGGAAVELGSIVDTEISVHYEAEDAVPDGVVTSNRLPVVFEGPVITGVSSLATVSASNGEVGVSGRNFGRVTGAVVVIITPDGHEVIAADSIEDLTESFVTVHTPDATRYLQPEGGIMVAHAYLLVGYRDADAPDGQVSSNWHDLRFTAELTTVTEDAPAGSVEVQVSSNDGWSPGDFAQLGAGGAVRRVKALGSLIFEAPIPTDLAVGTVILEVSAPEGDTTPPTITFGEGDRHVTVGDEVVVEYSCDDAGVGVEECAGTVAVGTHLDTSTPGDRTITVTAWDRNGNAHTASVTVAVDPAMEVGGLGLPRTGAAISVLVLLAAVLLGGGTLLVNRSRRLRRREVGAG